jgi:hypothetical protein
MTIEELTHEVAALRKDVSSCLRGITLLARHLGAVAPKAAATIPGGRVAEEAELDAKYGDPKVVVNPRDWAGESHKGGRMSECEPEFLDLLAVVLDGFADGETDPKKQKYKRDDSAKARGWSKRKRAMLETEIV